MYPNKSALSRVLVLSASIALSGCNAIVMKPHGDIAQQQAQLIVTSTLLMMLIIVPVIALTLLFAYRYRQSNTDATYAPDWDHSTRLELIIWGAPLLIIIALGAITWISTHKLDPFRPLDRIAEGRPVAADVKPLEVYAVAMDWKWLFIYPEQGIATVNELAAPVDRPIHFRFTSTSVMNTFYVPALAGMIYAMPGMETQLHAVINAAGVYDGMSAQYSGAGFSDMNFKFHGVSDEEFARWVESNKSGGNTLTRAGYLQLEQPSKKDPIRRFAGVEPGLWRAILDRCVDGKKMCSSQMMAIDAAGGAGKGGLASTMRSGWRDLDGMRRDRTVVAALCTPTNPLGLPTETDAASPAPQN
ncbi:MAG: ubiquinol oxidase subunit II [Burkholderiales bacterium]|nr:ubiquinol oxidase subunit II [Burkholderiales bacterium]MBW8893742.1 ubiquinol oxidase subunit II [Burkholderiales bacterium]